MKKGILLAAYFGLLTVGAIFSGCSKDKEDGLSSAFDGKITATVANADAYTSVVKVVALARGGEGSGDLEELASGSYANGSFTLTLPSALDTKFLWDITRVSSASSVSYSDKNAKICQINFWQGHSSSGYTVDYLTYRTTSETWGYFIYADRDVTVTGSTSGGYQETPKTYNVSLKKGWNIMYQTDSEAKIEYSNKAADGLKWYFSNAFDNDN